MEFYRLTIPIPKRPWQWIRFRIVTLLLLVAILAMAIAWRRDHQQLTARLEKYQNPSQAWAASQATGPPNATSQGDSTSAWCPASSDGGPEWLILEYDSAIEATAIVIHENYAPGAITRVTHFPKFGKEQTLWEGKYTPTNTGKGQGATLPVAARVKTSRIKVYLDTAAVPDWNEIDAVGVQAPNGVVTWARRAEASSVYGRNSQVQLQNFSPIIEGTVPR